MTVIGTAMNTEYSMAHMVQRPEEKPSIMFTLLGDERTVECCLAENTLWVVGS